MKIAKLFIPGNFETAFLYMGRLVIIDVHKNMHILGLQQFHQKLRMQKPDQAPMYEWLFARTDWLRNKQARSIYSNFGFALDVKKMVYDVCKQPLELDFNSFVSEAVIPLSGFKFDTVLDCSIYNGHVYVGTDTGLYHAKIDWENKKAANLVGVVRQRHDAKVIHTAARFATINISCGSDGLHSLYEDYDQDIQRNNFVQIEPCSYRSSWCNYDVINYANSVDPHIHHTKTALKPIALERETTVVQNVETSLKTVWDLPAKPVKENENGYSGINRVGTVKHAFNSERTFFVFTNEGDFYRIGLTYDPKASHLGATSLGAPKVQKPTRMVNVKRDTTEKFHEIMSTHGLPQVDSVVVETFDSIELLTPRGVITLLPEPSISIKTFPKSKQYQNMVLAITEGGLWFMSVFDDSIINNAVRKTHPKMEHLDEMLDSFGEFCDEDVPNEDVPKVPPIDDSPTNEFPDLGF